MTNPRLTARLGLAARCLVVLAGCWYVVLRTTWRDVLVVQAHPHAVIDGRLVLGGRYPCERAGDARVRVSLETRETVLVALPTNPAIEGIELHPGLWTTFVDSNWRWFGMAVLVAPAIFLVQALRWRHLLEVRGIMLPLARIMRIYLIGAFCNYFMLGSTGGDVVKACYAVQAAPGGKGAAIASVVADRLIGMVVLLAVCAMGLASPLIQASPTITMTIMFSIAAIVIGSSILVMLDRTPETTMVAGWRRSAQLVAQPLLDQCRPFLRASGAMKACLILSLVSHALLIAAFVCCAQAVGVAGHWGALVATIPVIAFAGSLPISYLGFGVMEPLAMTLLTDTGVIDANRVVMMFLLGRLPLFLWSLPGAAFLTMGSGPTIADASGSVSSSPPNPLPASDPTHP